MQVFDFLDQHPALYALVVVPLLTAILNAFNSWIASHWPVFAAVLQHAGFDPVGAVRKLLAARIPPLSTLVLVLLLPLGVMHALACAGCTPTEKQIAKTVLDVSGAMCTALESQPEPEWVTFSCAAAGVAGAAGGPFLAKVRKEDAPAFARRCAATGTVAH